MHRDECFEKMDVHISLKEPPPVRNSIGIVRLPAPTIWTATES